MLKRKTVAAISVAALAATTIALPAAVANAAAPVQLAGCNPCAGKKCGAAKAKCGAAKAKCGAAAAKCGAAKNGGKNPCNPCAGKKK